MIIKVEKCLCGPEWEINIYGNNGHCMFATPNFARKSSAVRSAKRFIENMKGEVKLVVEK